MCGICGAAGPPGGRLPAGLVQRMCDVMRHRGPDDQGFHHADGVVLGMRRLSIIDLEGGQQPIPNEDGSLWIVLNGEIYNYRELRALLSAAGHRFATLSDTEVIVHAYEEWGQDCVKRLNGMFAFAIWDRRRRALFLARDRMGIKPLYYWHGGDRLLFASELKALLQVPDLPLRVDIRALDVYLSIEHVPSPHCIVDGVRKLPPGHTLTWRQEDGELSLRHYWELPLAESEETGPARSVDQLGAELRAALREAVRKELVSDVPIGVFLSGGIDSSAVAALMSELAPGQVNSFSIGFNDSSFDESQHASLVARHLGTNHRELILEPDMMFELIPTVTGYLDEPLGDASIIPTYMLSRFAREHVKVALGGDGGDELMAGYPTMVAHRLAGYYNRLPRFLSRGAVPALVNRLPVSHDNISFDFKAKRFVEAVGMPVGERHLRWMGSFGAEERDWLLNEDVSAELGRRGRLDPAAEVLTGARLASPLNQVLLLDSQLYLEGDILVKLDRASMMASLEARVPLLNVDFVQHVARLPISLKLRGLTSKFLFKRALRRSLPDQILDRRKKGFGIPVAKWFRGPMKDELLDTLAHDRIRRDGFFRPKAVQRLLDDHMSGLRDRRKELWTLFVFHRWYETFLRERVVTPVEATR